MRRGGRLADAAALSYDEAAWHHGKRIAILQHGGDTPQLGVVFEHVWQRLESEIRELCFAEAIRTVNRIYHHKVAMWWLPLPNCENICTRVKNTVNHCNL
ncbi:hypothetical protein KM043_002610 [Ampulex compressa]|nr:hypothetical protein KM043_002610 [Ampulex compressa]